MLGGAAVKCSACWTRSQQSLSRIKAAICFASQLSREINFCLNNFCKSVSCIYATAPAAAAAYEYDDLFIYSFIYLLIYDDGSHGRRCRLQHCKPIIRQLTGFLTSLTSLSSFYDKPYHISRGDILSFSRVIFHIYSNTLSIVCLHVCRCSLYYPLI